MCQHFEVDAGILMASEPNGPHFALLFGFEQGFGCAAGTKDQVGIVFVSISYTCLSLLSD
jgi:hypothetical protein